MDISLHNYIIILVIHLTTSFDLVCQDELSNHYNQQALTTMTDSSSAIQEEKKELRYKLPPENKVVLYKDIYLQWENTNASGGNRLQLSRDKMFKDNIIDTVLSDHHFLIPALFPHKTYYWRVIHQSDTDAYEHSFTFFKTSSIELDESESVSPLEIIPTWIEDTEVICIFNPALVKYTLQVTDDNSDTKLKRACSAEKFAFETASWPRGAYIMTFLIERNQHTFKTFVLK